MKKIIMTLAMCAIVSALPIAAQADPKADLQALRAYFKKKFPTVKLEAYSDGLYALPVAADRRKEWEGLMEFPPYEFEFEKGRKFWEENNLASCFKNGGKDIAHKYPYWDEKRKEVRTVVLDINDCLKRKGKEPIKDLNKGTMAQVVAYMKSLSNGKKLAVNLSAPGMRAEYERGKKFYWTRRGQLNFSCANCHIQSAGMFVGGNILSAELGHTTGFPVYRLKWGGLGTLHRRYGGCNKQVRAKPFKPQSREYRALEVYESYMSTGIPLKVPGQRG